MGAIVLHSSSPGNSECSVFLYLGYILKFIVINTQAANWPELLLSLNAKLFSNQLKFTASIFHDLGTCR